MCTVHGDGCNGTSGSSKELMVAVVEGICEQRLLLMLWVLEKQEGRGEQEQEGM